MPANSEVPRVSAIITTLRRPYLVTRAIESVLQQTFTDFELLVVVDGPDDATVEAVTQILDPRIRLIVLPKNVGLGEARNAGIRESRSEWVAFLDDDDEWFPSKLTKQISAAGESGPGTNFVACRFDERTSKGLRVRPKFFPAPGENWSESFYCHKVLLLPSTFLVTKQLMLAFPFRLRRHEDVDWLLRIQAAGVVKPVWVEDSLAIYHCEATHSRISTDVEWNGRYQWYRDNPTLLTAKALPYYIGMLCIPEAQNSPSPVRACGFLLKEALTRGKMSLKALAYLAMVTCSTRDWRTHVRERWPILQRLTSLRSAKVLTT